MVTLRVEFFCPDYDAWKQSFDADPFGRGRSGVTRHRLSRAADDPNRIVVQLDFEDLATAQALRERGADTWKAAEANGLMKDLHIRIYEEIETSSY